MNIDQNKFMNAVIERTNQKLSQLQNQVILLETQLSFVLDSNKLLQEELDKAKKKKEKSSVNDFDTPA